MRHEFRDFLLGLAASDLTPDEEAMLDAASEEGVPVGRGDVRYHEGRDPWRSESGDLCASCEQRRLIVAGERTLGPRAECAWDGDKYRCHLWKAMSDIAPGIPGMTP